MWFLLDVETDPSARRATFRLLGSDERFLDAHEVALADHAPAQWAAAFDTRRHLARTKDISPPAEQLEALGKFLGEHVLGASIATALADGIGQRTVLVRLPEHARLHAQTDDGAVHRRLRPITGRAPACAARSSGPPASASR